LRLGGRNKGDEQDKEARHSTSKGRHGSARVILRADDHAGKGSAATGQRATVGGESRGFFDLVALAETG
jgi:hypothetical protein